MLPRLRAWVGRAPQLVVALVLLTCAAPAVAGPLAFCLRGDDPPRVVAASEHCEMMAQGGEGMHVPTVDAAATGTALLP
jgi:hypothetical protein